MVSPDGLLFYRGGPYRQKGHGIGGFFGSLLSKLIPFAKNIMLPAAKKYVLPHMVDMAKNVAGDVIEQRSSLKDAFKQHGINALKETGRQITGQSGSGLPGRRKCTKRKLSSRGVSKNRKKPKLAKKRATSQAKKKVKGKPRKPKKKQKITRRTIFD